MAAALLLPISAVACECHARLSALHLSFLDMGYARKARNLHMHASKVLSPLTKNMHYANSSPLILCFFHSLGSSFTNSSFGLFPIYNSNCVCQLFSMSTPLHIPASLGAHPRRSATFRLTRTGPSEADIDFSEVPGAEEGDQGSRASDQ